MCSSVMQNTQADVLSDERTVVNALESCLNITLGLTMGHCDHPK